MYRILYSLADVIAAAVFIIPVFCIYKRIFIHSAKRTTVYIIFGLYLAEVLSLVGFPNIRGLTVDPTVNPIPFADMVSDLANAALNVLLFIPFGFFLPILWDSFRSLKRSAAAGAVTAGVVEVSQIFTYRTTDINDLITNVLGTVIGYFAAKCITKNFSRLAASDAKNKDFYIICVTVVIVMFLMKPFVSSMLSGFLYR